MAGPSPRSKGFRPIDLMEGISVEDAFATMTEIDEALTDDYGKDEEIKVVILSFLLGRALKNSKIGIDKAFAMCASARQVTI